MSDKATRDALVRQYTQEAEHLRALASSQKQNNSNDYSYYEFKTPLDKLYNFSMSGQSSSMRQQMLDDAFVIEGIAILGQWTTFYAAPNTGKTLITIHQLVRSIESGQIDGESVFYINADDNFRGLVDKVEIAEEFGFHMIAPNQNGFRVSAAIDLIADLASSSDAHGTIVVLDTLKKFTDLMDKRKASEFGQIARDFVSAGGTIIVLAHTNKHKAADGKSVFAGTSDIRDDSDCVYIIEQVANDNGNTVVEFVNDKARGDVEDIVAFSYQRLKGQTYRNLLDSIIKLPPGESRVRREQSQVQAQLDKDQEIIESILHAIEAGHDLKSDLVKFVNTTEGFAQRMIKDVLDRRDGATYELGHRWQSTREEHNRHRYASLSPPGQNNCKTK